MPPFSIGGPDAYHKQKQKTRPQHRVPSLWRECRQDASNYDGWRLVPEFLELGYPSATCHMRAGWRVQSAERRMGYNMHPQCTMIRLPACVEWEISAFHRGQTMRCPDSVNCFTFLIRLNTSTMRCSPQLLNNWRSY